MLELSAPYEQVNLLAEDVLDTLDGEAISTVLISLAVAMRRAATVEPPDVEDELSFVQNVLQYVNLILSNAGGKHGVH